MPPRKGAATPSKGKKDGARRVNAVDNGIRIEDNDSRPPAAGRSQQDQGQVGRKKRPGKRPRTRSAAGASFLVNSEP
jgi:hypothetical protein